jgi:hypothetical protein
MGKLLAVLLVLGLPLVGAINYVRNEPLDNELKDRTYGGVSDEDLAALLGAYGQEIKNFKSGAIDAEPTTTDHNDPGRFGHYGEKVNAFEKFQRTNSSWRKERGQVFESEATLEAIRHEKSIRDRGLHKEWKRIWRRVSTF